MSSSVFKVYSAPDEDEDRGRGNLLLPREVGGGLDDSTTTEDEGGPSEAPSSSSSAAVVDERLKIDSNLVIVVGKDGSVHVDQKTLHSLLANETTDTSVSVVRIASPTPSIEDEIAEERRRELEELKLHQELEAAGLVADDDDDAGSISADAPAPPQEAAASTSKVGETGGGGGVSTRRSRANVVAARNKEDVLLDGGGEPPHVSLMVEGFYPPAEAKKFAEEVLTLAGLAKPLSVETAEPVDYEFQRYVVANDHCYTPLTSPSQKLPPRSYFEQEQEVAEVTAPVTVVEEGVSPRKRAAAAAAVSNKVVPPPAVAAVKSRPRKKSVAQREESSSNDAEDLQSILEGSDSDSDYTEESSYPDEDDNESDLDFDISGKSKKRKSGSKNRSGSKKKEEPTPVEAREVKKKLVVVKSPTKKVEPKLVTPVSMLTKSVAPKTYGPKKTAEPVVVTPSVAAPVVVQPAPTPIVVQIVKKVKPVAKPAPHVEALFSDMTSLFSTPDIIKKVGQSKAVTPVTPTPSSSGRGFVQISATKTATQKLPAQISIQTHTSASEENLIDALVGQDQEMAPVAAVVTQAVPTATPLTEDIVKMLENNLPPGGVQEPVLPITDNSILAALGSNDDGGLPEDLLQHVAELAENKELQEILDKQVLGVIGTDVPAMPLPSTSTVIPVIAPQQIMQPVIAPQPQPPPTTRPATAESLPTMTVKEQLMPRKEAIQIRRSDGRIITLPPIEAPATRSKRRAQTGPATPAASPAAPAIPTPSPSTTPVQPNVVVASTPTIYTPTSSKTPAAKHQTAKSTVGTISYDDGSGSLLIDESRTKSGGGAKGGSAASSRRTSESSNNSGRGKRQSTAAVAAVVAAEAAEDEVESDESWNSEDDPDRLWCICRQPHNNRFMICCDVCEDWFHGKCVNITKAMGQQMEADGIEWTCPNCLKKKQDKQQPKMTDFLVSSSSSSSLGAGSVTMSPKTVATITAAATANASTAPSATATSVSADQTACVVCGKPARANSVYCSDNCIRKHAGVVATGTPALAPSRSVTVKQQTVVDGIKKLDGSPVKGASSKSGPIIVMERKTGRCLTGKNAPTAENLKAWLQSHPTFEVVPPNSPQAAIILAKQAEVRKLQLAKESQKKAAASPAATNQQQTPATAAKTAQSKHSDKKSNNTLFAPSIPQKVTVTKVPSKTSVATPPSKSSSSSSVGSAKTPSSSATTTSSASKAQKRPAPESKPAAKTPPAAPAENIRVTVKKTLKEHLLQRTSEVDEKIGTRLAEPEIDKFVAEVEEEMFALFNKDTGTKYRAKYRSLVFNIKDRKNLSLFQKICEKRIEARQLVRMTPEELASQELAQWRENENKHQLEMIKKSELDLLACAKNYVLKTHKGEEVIEGKIDDRVTLDPTTAVEDVVAVLNNSTVSSTSELDSTKESGFRSKDFDLSFGKYSTGLYGSGSITSSTLAATATSSSVTASSSSSSSKKKDSRRSRSRSRSRDRRRDRSRSRHKRRRSRSRSRHGSRDRDRARSRHRDHRKQQDSKESQKAEEKTVPASSLEKDRNEAVGKPVEAKKPKKTEAKPPAPESGNLIDQILASAGAAVNKPAGEPVEKEPSSAPTLEEPPPKPKPPTIASIASPPDQQDQEPTSTVTIPTPPHSTDFDGESPSADFASTNVTAEDQDQDDDDEALRTHWTGNVHMVDVASVEMSIRSVSGNIEDVAKDFSEDLDICGTIKPEIVWDYIGQIKKSANKEICLVRFHSNERAAYYTLYQHLYSRKRYSVIKSPSKAIKDFYVFPLPAEQMIPMILKPLTGVGIVEGDQKPDLLLGIIVKVWGKRSSSGVAMAAALPAKTPRRSGKSSAAVSPSFALMQQVITKYATVNKKPDLDAGTTPPGSPGGSGAPSPPVISAATKPASVPPPPQPPPSVVIRRSESASPDGVADIDMDIIKRPALIAAGKVGGVQAPEVPAAVVIDDDDDEPYSPGGGSDDSDHFADVTAIVETNPESERIRLEMEEINRKIAEEKNEIVGIISKAELKADEIKSTLTPSLITDISIPSNLSEILASINKSAAPAVSSVLEPAGGGKEKVEGDDEEEYVPTAPSSMYSAYKSGGYSYGKPTSTAVSSIPVLVSNPPAEAGTSKLSKLSEAELLSMVPDESYLQPAKKSTVVTVEDDDDVVELDSDDSVPPQAKKSKWAGSAASEPPPPGLEDEINL